MMTFMCLGNLSELMGVGVPEWSVSDDERHPSHVTNDRRTELAIPAMVENGTVPAHAGVQPENRSAVDDSGEGVAGA